MLDIIAAMALMLIERLLESGDPGALEAIGR